jgi:hypothetical protein
MSKKPRVIFNPKRIKDGERQIEAHTPGDDVRYIKGLTSHEEARAWIEGPQKVTWLKSQGLAK